MNAHIATFDQDAVERLTAEAIQRFADKHNCSQAVLMTFAPYVGLSEDQARRLATPFGLGMTQGLTCGLVSGGLMLIGLRHGGGGPDGSEAKSLTYDLARELLTHVQSVHGSFLCRDLLTADPAIPAELVRAGAEHLFETHCVSKFATVIRKTAELAFGEL